jgi:hypothetical protein
MQILALGNFLQNPFDQSLSADASTMSRSGSIATQSSDLRPHQHEQA